MAELESAEEFASRIYFACTDDDGCEFRDEDAIPLIVADRDAVRRALLEEIQQIADMMLGPNHPSEADAVHTAVCELLCKYTAAEPAVETGEG